jgi:pyrroloquinoline quinone (PQQ) biosynthesis protein C
MTGQTINEDHEKRTKTAANGKYQKNDQHFFFQPVSSSRFQTALLKGLFIDKYAFIALFHQRPCYRSSCACHVGAYQ